MASRFIDLSPEILNVIKYIFIGLIVLNVFLDFFLSKKVDYGNLFWLVFCLYFFSE